MANSQRCAVLSITLCLIAAAASAQDDSDCDLSQIFNMDEVRAACTNENNDIDITLTWADSLLEGPITEGGPRTERIDKAQPNLGPRLAESKILVEDFRGAGNGPRTLAASTGRSVILAGVARIVARAETGGAYRSVSVVLPASSLICGDTLNSEEVIIPLILTKEDEDTEEEGQVAMLPCGGGGNEGVQGKALDWRIDLSPIDNSSGEGSEAAVDFNLDKTWGYNYRPNRTDYLSWSENTWKLKLDGAGSTDKDTFYNSLKGEVAWSYKKYKLGKNARDSIFPVYWLSGHLGTETTFDLDNRDLVYGMRADAFLNTKGIARSLIPGMRTTASIRPFVSFGVEAVDPSKRDDGTVPDNYERLSGRFWWKFPVTESVYFELNWEALYILDDKDANNMMVDQLTDRLDIGVSMVVAGSGEVRPFFKWTKGQQAPLFQDVEEYLIGVLWELGGVSSERQ